jgi:5-methylcytosine-specific restriction endonuclease McrA
MYCGHDVGYQAMEVEHVIPLSRGGRTVWANVVVACHRCNHRKDARTPEEAHMKLLAVPYAPNVAEYLILSNRRILADQMEFLKPLVPLRRAS